MKSLHFLTVMPSPYQRETFKAIDASGWLRISVDYFAAAARDRLWTHQPMAPYETVLPGVQFLQGGAAGRFNPVVLRRLREVRADLVVVSDYSAPSAQLAMRALGAARRPWVYWGELPGVNARGPVGLWARRHLQAPIGRATAIAAIGSRAAAAYGRQFPQVPVFDIPYFCDLAAFQCACEARPPGPAERVRVLFSGQLIARKGVDLLLDAFTQALPHAPGLELRIAGDGPMRGELERAAATFADRVVFLGHRDPPELPGLFGEAELFVLPSRHDGWGVVLNEALGAGLPILASDAVGAAHDLVSHGVNGLVTPAGDVQALRDALVELARDPARRHSMAAASRARATGWGLEEGVRRWRALCAEILSDGAAARPAIERAAP